MNTIKRWLQLLKARLQYARDLEDLIRVMWLHSGHPKCGIDQMTQQERDLLRRIVDSPFSWE